MAWCKCTNPFPNPIMTEMNIKLWNLGYNELNFVRIRKGLWIATLKQYILDWWMVLGEEHPGIISVTPVPYTYTTIISNIKMMTKPIHRYLFELTCYITGGIPSVSNWVSEWLSLMAFLDIKAQVICVIMIYTLESLTSPTKIRKRLLVTINFLETRNKTQKVRVPIKLTQYWRQLHYMWETATLHKFTRYVLKLNQFPGLK